MAPHSQTTLAVDAWATANPTAALRLLRQQINAAKVLWPDELKNVKIVGDIVRETSTEQ